MLDLILFWLSYAVQGTLVVTTLSSTFALRISWLIFVGSSLHVLYRAQPTFALSTHEHKLNMIWICGLLLSFATLLDMGYKLRIFIFFAYTFVQTCCTLYFIVAKAILVLRT